MHVQCLCVCKMKSMFIAIVHVFESLCFIISAIPNMYLYDLFDPIIQ